MFAKVRTWGKDKTINLPTSLKQSSSSRTGAAITHLNELKRTAKGDASIPTERRLHLHVVGCTDNPNARDPPSGNFFFDARWKVGRVLDDAARRLKVENVNNRRDDEGARLRVFHVEAGRFLEFAEVIGETGVMPGHTIVLLRGAGVLLQNNK